MQLPGGFGLLLALGFLTYGLNKVNPNYHAFSLLDLSIAYPYKDELISTTSLVLASIIGPGVIIFLVAILLVPGPAASKNVPIGLLIRQKIWEWNTGWLGLGLSEMVALVITTGLKNAVGKPRPNMLARCQPDLSGAAIQQQAVSSFASGYTSYWVLVDVGICTQTNPGALKDGFRSFPSGHSSTAWSGLVYLSLYLCAKFAMVFPHLPLATSNTTNPSTSSSALQKREQDVQSNASSKDRDARTTPSYGRRNEAAAPPLYLLIMLLVPIGVACYISATRFFDYRHHGFDIISGAVIGAFTAWFSFRLYHMPLSRGSGWAWGPRSPRKAFAIGVGSTGWVSAEDLPARGSEDLEMAVLPHRMVDRQAESGPVSSDGRDSGPASRREAEGYASLPTRDSMSSKPRGLGEAR
ncbi:MAG: hypothetical protein Q9162_003694 [Coniocarpon cinnabarinum]